MLGVGVARKRVTWTLTESMKVGIPLVAVRSLWSWKFVRACVCERGSWGRSAFLGGATCWLRRAPTTGVVEDSGCGEVCNSGQLCNMSRVHTEKLLYTMVGKKKRACMGGQYLSVEPLGQVLFSGSARVLWWAASLPPMPVRARVYSSGTDWVEGFFYEICMWQPEFAACRRTTSA